MAMRIPASQRTREELTALIEGRLSTASAKDELVKLATRLIVEEALEGETADAIGRDYYEHGAQPGQGYRNGYRRGRLKTAEGAMEYSAPQIAGRDEPYRSAIREHLKGQTQGLEDLAIEMLARGLSVRDIEDAFKDENGRLLLSKTAVSQLGERLWEDYQTFVQRDLSEYEISYLFVDGIAERLRPGAKREPVLAAWGFTVEGRRVLLHLMAGSKEDAETATAFFEICFPRAARQRCLAHRMRNLAVKVPEDVWSEFKVRAQAVYQAPSRAIARELAAGVVADYGRLHDSAVACFMDDFEACIAHLRFPVTHRRAIRTTNLLERLFVEERRRLKIIPNAFGERAILKLMFGALIRAAERWKSIKVTEFERRQLSAVKKELDQEYEAQVGLDRNSSKDASHKISSSSQT
jgi:putative transposase